MRIATWNVNSVRARQDRLLSFLGRHAPDVLCLQELKAETDEFPLEAVRELGYEAAVLGQRTYNGVAILSKTPIEDVRTGMGGDDEQARLIAGTVRGVRVICAYVPNGGEPASPKFAYKLEWMKRLRAHLAEAYAGEKALALCGDFNVAPTDLDVKNPEAWKASVLACPEARAALAEIRTFGLVDTLRLHQPDTAVYSWWDYRMLGFPKNDGLRIDHIDVTAELAARCVSVKIDREERKGKQPSDHAPVLADFSD
jgi:exodeoxyribonuclease III